MSTIKNINGFVLHRAFPSVLQNNYKLHCNQAVALARFKRLLILPCNTM